MPYLHPFVDDSMEPIGGDGSARRYFRVQEPDGGTAVLMEMTGVTPGHDPAEYVRIGNYLRSVGVRTPEVYESDVNAGVLLVEDFGDLSFKRSLEEGENPETLYALAVDVLRHMRARALVSGIKLPEYRKSHVHEARRLVIDWYVPALLRKKNIDRLAEEYLKVWADIESGLPPCPQGLLHIDFHVENLMLLPKGKGIDRCGILDFQGAMAGPLPYDLANLLEDARADVDPALRAAMIDRYCEGMDGEERQIFEDWYRVLATQFHCRVLGQFIRLAVRDGKPKYLEHLPRVAAYLKQDMDHPVMRPLKEWFAAQRVDFSVPADLDADSVKQYIREDVSSPEKKNNVDHRQPPGPHKAVADHCR